DRARWRARPYPTARVETPQAAARAGGCGATITDHGWRRVCRARTRPRSRCEQHMEYLFSARLVGLGVAAGMFAVLGKLQSPLQMIFDFRQGLAGELLEVGIAAVLDLVPEQCSISLLILDLAVDVVAVEGRAVFGLK